MTTRATTGNPVSVAVRDGAWTLLPDRAPDAEPVTFAMRCAACGRQSRPSLDVADADAQAWTFHHTRRHLGHRTYRELITRPWRTHPNA